ncbi:hypothetical protein [Vibrio maerlii]|uniref:hypothetical protein n=1 Tax=Vibrio maerlii TaxID=2231648 RepID=UPI000E3C6FC8|nr:hypothetical protein [Vibrio maerlii]
MLDSISPLVSAIAALASAFAVFKANDIAETVKNFHKNSVLNHRELELLGKALEKLSIYDVWCKTGGVGESVNYHDSNEVEYSSRDDATIQIPRDLKYLLIQLSAHSEDLNAKIVDWESNFISKVNDDYILKDELVSEKIKALREIRSGGM